MGDTEDEKGKEHDTAGQRSIDIRHINIAEGEESDVRSECLTEISDYSS